jgi:hypothetical protein
MADRFADRIEASREAKREFQRIKRQLRHIRLLRLVAEARMKDGSPRACVAAFRAYRQVVEVDPTAN